MDRLPLVVASEIKYMYTYTEQYSYNKKRKTTSCQFHLITKKDNLARGYNCMGKVRVYQTIFQSTFDILFEIYSTKK